MAGEEVKDEKEELEERELGSPSLLQILGVLTALRRADMMAAIDESMMLDG